MASARRPCYWLDWLELHHPTFGLRGSAGTDQKGRSFHRAQRRDGGWRARARACARFADGGAEP